MKKITVSVPFDAEKLSAAKLYMAQKDLSFEKEMEKAADALYSKHVPAGVREFIDMRSGTVSLSAVPKPRKPKPMKTEHSA